MGSFEKEYLKRPVPDKNRESLLHSFGTLAIAQRFVAALDNMRAKLDISDWKREIDAIVTDFEKDALVPKKALRDTVTAAMDFEAYGPEFGDLAGKYADEKPAPRPIGRISLSIDELLSTQRSALRQKPALAQQEVVTIQRPSLPTFLNVDRRAIQIAVERVRAEKLFRTPVIGSALKLASELSFRQRKFIVQNASKRPQLLFTQAVALAQKLIAEVARNPEAYVRLSQSETTAMSNAKTNSTPVKTADPKAALRLLAINTMNQLYTPQKVTATPTQLGVAALQSAIKRVDDNRKKHLNDRGPAKEVSMKVHLAKLGYSAAESARLVPLLAKNELISECVLSGTISSRGDLDSLTKNLEPAATKHLRL